MSKSKMSKKFREKPLYEESLSDLVSKTQKANRKYPLSEEEMTIALQRQEMRVIKSELIKSLEDRGREVSQLQIKIDELQRRLIELETFEKRSTQDGGVFVSYSHADQDIVNELVAELESDNINYWLDDKDLFAGQVIDKAISDGIQKNYIFMTILSPSAIKSRWVEREFDEASHEEIEGRKIILPVICNGLQAEDVPARVRRKLYVDISKDFKVGYQKLKKSIIFHLEEYKKNRQDKSLL